MKTAINRIQFLRGDLSGRYTPIRPPWSGSENTFIDICDGCGECIAQCPSHIIKKGRGQYPIIDFNAGECTFCGDCVNACEPKALSYAENQTPWAVIASINTENCLAFKGTECRSCYDPCEVGSIKIKPQLGGVSIPTLDLSLCTGCGACYAVCPTSAISMNNSITSN